MLSMKAKYGLRALTILAKQYGQGPVLIAELATKERIPRKFLELILLDLKKKGILRSKKGKGGGYHLSRPLPADDFTPWLAEFSMERYGMSRKR